MSSRSFPRSAGGDTSSISTLTCNRCRKVLTATVFLCSCDCIFCEACTYEHFEASPQCPSCRTTLRANDFLELCIAEESSAAPSEYAKNTFQMLLTKIQKSRSKGMTHQDMCSRLLHALETDKRAVRFMMKQFVVDSSTQESMSGNMGRAYSQLKDEFTQLQQKSSSQRLQYEQSVADLERKNHALNTSIHDQKKKLLEATTQLDQFREYHANEGMARLPSTSHSHSSGSRGKRLGSSHNNDQPPIQGFIMQKQAREHAVQQERRQGRAPNIPGSITPIQVPGAHSSHHHHPRHSSSGHSGGGMPMHVAPPPSTPRLVSAPPTPRIRDLSSGYVFSSSRRSDIGGSSSHGNNHHYRGGHVVNSSSYGYQPGRR